MPPVGENLLLKNIWRFKIQIGRLKSKIIFVNPLCVIVPLYFNVLQYFAANRSGRSQMFVSICVPKNFANFTAKHLCWSLFLINLHVFAHRYIGNFGVKRVDNSTCYMQPVVFKNQDPPFLISFLIIRDHHIESQDNPIFFTSYAHLSLVKEGKNLYLLFIFRYVVAISWTPTTNRWGCRGY